MEASNTKAMREALKSVIHSMESEARYNCTEQKRLGKFGQTQEDLCEGCRRRGCECWTMTLKRECEAALAKPPRNCDMGTAEEQTARYNKFCYKNKTAERSCGDCPAYSAYAIVKKDCRLAWAQMPYEAEKGDAKWSKK